MKHLRPTFLLFILPTLVFAQNSNRVFKSIENKSTYFQINVNDGFYKISRYSSKIIETTFIPKNEKNNTKSHAVVLKSNINYSLFKEDKEKVTIITDGILIKIQKVPFKISYFYKDKEITSEKTGYSKDSIHQKIQLNLTKDEVLYGGGARVLGMNRRGNRLQLYNRAHYGYETRSELMNFTLPIVLSSKMYMIHFDNAPIGYLDLDSKKDNSITYETISGRKTYQVIVGDSWIDLIDSYTDLTGKQPLPPRWTFGNFSSRFGYHSQKETETTINKFKEEKIPVDAVILDLYWFGKDIQGTMGNLEVYKDSFPDIKGMISKFKKKGVKTVLITEPFVLTTSKKWKEAAEKKILGKDSIGNPYKFDFYFGNTGLIDIYNPEGKKWFWNIYKDLRNIGVKGVWGDLGEPEVHPSKLLHETGTADEVHNIYGHDWARLIFEGYQKDFPTERPFILMRAGAAGSQRFGMIPWSGDVNRTWGGLQSQPEIALQMGMQGLGYMHSDLGGFAGANLDDELYTRWLQYGVFQPVFRPHAQEDVASEPVFRSDKAKMLAKKSIELRYKLLPYNYNLAFQNNQQGTPFMRPLFFEETNNSLLNLNSNAYLWGTDFLISPVLKPEIKTQNVYFPKTATWFNFYTENKITGGQIKSIKVQENSIPTFVRAGAFIPMANSIQTTDDYHANFIELHYYHDVSVTKSERQFYNDNGLLSNAFEKGDYELLEFEAVITKRCLEIDFDAEFGKNWNPKNKEIKLVIHNINWNPKKIKVGRNRVRISPKQNILTIPLSWNVKKELKVKITRN
jgi:alpha-glucosidase (family GH31 glycosyl hydrolase)